MRDLSSEATSGKLSVGSDWVDCWRRWGFESGSLSIRWRNKTLESPMRDFGGW